MSETTKIVRAIALLLANVNISNAPTPAHEKIAQNIVDDISCMLKGAIGSDAKVNPIVESKQEFDIGEYVKSGEIRSTIAMMKAASTKAIPPVVEPIPPVVEKKVVAVEEKVVEPIPPAPKPIPSVVEEKVVGVEEKVVEPIAAAVEEKVDAPKPIPPAPPAPPKPPIPPAPKSIATAVVKEESKSIATAVVKEENDGKEKEEANGIGAIEEEKALNALSTVRRKSIIRAFMIDKGAKADILRDPRNLTVENAISYADADSFWMYVSSVLG